VSTLKARIRRGHAWSTQSGYKSQAHPNDYSPWTGTVGSPTRFTLSDFWTRHSYLWEVTFPAPYGKFCNRSCFSLRDALRYANKTVGELRFGVLPTGEQPRGQS
jgi:hypothetical protein